jgi:hypothetical protein
MDMFTYVVQLKELQQSFDNSPYVEADKEKLTEFDGVFAGYVVVFNDVKKEEETDAPTWPTSHVCRIE